MGAVGVFWDTTVAGAVWRSSGLTRCVSAVARTLSPEAEGVIAGNAVPDDVVAGNTVPDNIPNSAVGMEKDNAAVG
jgi:hypothetical protein